MRHLIALIGVLSLTILVGDATAGGKRRPSKGDISQAKEAQFKAIDKNDDGSISLEEFRQAHKGSGTSGTKIEQDFKTRDKDKDGKLTKDEFYGEQPAKEKEKEAPKKKK